MNIYYTTHTHKHTHTEMREGEYDFSGGEI